METNKVSNEKELAEALSCEQNCIEIEGNLAEKVIKIKATGPAAWFLCVGIIGIVMFELAKTTGSSGETTSEIQKKLFSSAVVTPVAISILGPSTFMAAASIALAAGGIGVLNKLRDYNIQNIPDNKIRLIKKSK